MKTAILEVHTWYTKYIRSRNRGTKNNVRDILMECAKDEKDGTNDAVLAVERKKHKILY